MLPPINAARIPLAGLSALAGLRTSGGVSVVASDTQAWIRWEGPAKRLVPLLMAIPGAEYFTCRDDRWYRLGEAMPVFDVPPPGAATPLERLLFPAPFTASQPGHLIAERPVCRLVPSSIPHPTTALRCDLAVLNPWVESATTAELKGVQACLCDDRVLIVGPKLPWVDPAERFRGKDVLIPIGYRPEPDWSEAALRETAGINRDEILMLGHDHIETIPRETLEPLRRARFREAMGQLKK